MTFCLLRWLVLFCCCVCDFSCTFAAVVLRLICFCFVVAFAVFLFDSVFAWRACACRCREDQTGRPQSFVGLLGAQYWRHREAAGVSKCAGSPRRQMAASIACFAKAPARNLGKLPRTASASPIVSRSARNTNCIGRNNRRFGRSNSAFHRDFFIFRRNILVAGARL
jgi:hypothetical protein